MQKTKRKCPQEILQEVQNVYDDVVAYEYRKSPENFRDSVTGQLLSPVRKRYIRNYSSRPCKSAPERFNHDAMNDGCHPENFFVPVIISHVLNELVNPIDEPTSSTAGTLTPGNSTVEKVLDYEEFVHSPKIRAVSKRKKRIRKQRGKSAELKLPKLKLPN